ncbi:MAG: hypothetical protein FJ100_08390 [Deltaproteobacteria bacterium]|nr:hypothetical protein [Deltaproteobacteria bacterium]
MTIPLRLTLHPDLPADSQDEASARLWESLRAIRPGHRAPVRAAETLLGALDRWRAASPWGDRPLDRLDVLAHGSPGRLAIGDPFDAQGFLGFETLARWQLMEAIESHVARDGTVGLLGCSVGMASRLSPTRDGAMLAWALARSCGRRIGVPAFGLYADSFDQGCDGLDPGNPSIAWFGPQTRTLPEPMDPGGVPPARVKRPQPVDGDHSAVLDAWWSQVRVATVLPAAGYLGPALADSVHAALGGAPGQWFSLTGWLGEALARVALHTSDVAVQAELLADGPHGSAKRLFVALRPPLTGWEGRRAGRLLPTLRRVL